MLLSSFYTFSTGRASLVNEDWRFPTVNGTMEYAPSSGEKNFFDPKTGRYFVFYASSKLDESDYTIDPISNKLTLKFDPIDNSSITVYYIGG